MKTYLDLLVESLGGRTAYHVVPLSRLKRVMAEGLVPRIGPRSKRAEEPEPAIYLFPDLETVGSCLEHWLMNEFHEDTKLALLRVRVPEDAHVIDGHTYEYICYHRIPPENIEVISRDAADELPSFYGLL